MFFVLDVQMFLVNFIFFVHNDNVNSFEKCYHLLLCGNFILIKKPCKYDCGLNVSIHQQLYFTQLCYDRTSKKLA